MLPARSAGRAAELAERFPGSSTPVVDLADPASVAALEHDDALPDRLDSLHHVAGVIDLAPVAEQDDARLRDQIEVNLVAPAVLTRMLLPALRAARGVVVFVNSGAGINAHPTWSGYAASKFGLRGFADALRGEEAEHGVRVTSVFPGRTATAMQEEVHRQEGRDYDPSQWIDPEEVVAAMVHVLDLGPTTTIPELVLKPAG